MADERSGGLRRTLDLHLSEIFRSDFWIACVGAIGGLVLALVAPEQLARPVELLVQAVGVVLGAVVASLAILAAMLDQPFLRKLRAINRKPQRYLAPFVFTAVLGVAALLLLVILGAMTSTTQPAVLATAAAVTGMLAFWTLASPIPLLRTLLDFVALKAVAIDLPDDIDIRPHATGTDGP